MNKSLLICFSAFLSLGGIFPLEAQTTLTGDHLIDGDLIIGTSSNKSRLVVNGETGTNALPSLEVTGDGGVLFGEPWAGLFWDARLQSLSLGDGFLAASASIVLYGTVDGGSRNIAAASAVMGSNNCVALAGSGIGYSNASVALAGGFLSDSSFSVAISGGTVLADYGFAAGSGVSSSTDGCFAVGMFNSARTGTDPGQDQLFVVGNGTGNSQDPDSIAYRDAFWVQRNGDVRIAKRQGDILMGEFGNPE